MTERLDRIEAILEGTAQKQAKNTEDIDTLLGAIAATEANVQNLTAKAGYTDELFEVLRAEANADRQETGRLFNDTITQFDIDRQRSDKRFNEALGLVGAAQENIQRLLVELINTNRDVSRVRDRVDGLGSRVDTLEQAS